METEIKEAVLKVLDSGQYILGEEGKLFEDEVSEYLNVAYAIGVSSGTDALKIALKVCDIGQGDEVITTPYSFISTASSIIEVGAEPVFVDIGEDKNIDADLIEKSITRRTKAILPVHLFGRQCDMKSILDIADRNDLWVVEDMAQAFGLPLVGDVGCLSFYPTKVLAGVGDGGMVITDIGGFSYESRMLRNNGTGEKRYEHEVIGMNARLDEIQAAVLRVKLKYLEETKRTFKYDETKYYPIPIHLQPCMVQLKYVKGDFPNAEKEANKVKKNYDL